VDVVSVRCGYCKNRHESKEQVLRCRDAAQSGATVRTPVSDGSSRDSELGQVADRSRSLANSYSAERKAQKKEKRTDQESNRQRVSSVQEQSYESRSLRRQQRQEVVDSEFELKRRSRASVVRTAEVNKKYRFRCVNCSHEFISAATPWPRCRRCPAGSQVVCVCSGKRCGIEFVRRDVGRLCDRCSGKASEIRGSMKGGISEVWKTGRHSKGT